MEFDSSAIRQLRSWNCRSHPPRAHCVDLITAAGSLNYVDLDLFFPEASRLLTRDGVFVVYDFSPGRSFRNTGELDRWFTDFCNRYPPPPNESRDLSPALLADLASGFQLRGHLNFEIAVPLTGRFYLDYIMTETNVAAAIRRGVSQSEIKSWCVHTLERIWCGSEQEVIFRGYFACLSIV